MKYDKIFFLLLLSFFFIQIARAENYGKSAVYASSVELFSVNIKYPLYENPIVNVKEGDFIYALIDVDYNGTNVTNLNVDDFTVNIGTKNAFINSVSYDEVTSYYELNITVPSNNAGTKQDFWVNVTYEGIWKTDIEMQSVWYFTPTTTTLTTMPVGGGGGGGGGGTTTTRMISNFIVDKDVIQLQLTPGHGEISSLKISNVGEIPLNINVTQKNLDKFLLFDESKKELSFDLRKTETKDIKLNFSVSEQQEPGVYMGRIIITGDGIEKTVSVIIEVESVKPLFDVKVEILPEYKEVFPGGDVLAQLTIYNLGKIGRVDVDIEYGVKDFDGNIITSSHVIMAVETQISAVERVTMPLEAKPDSYVFYAKVSYNGVVGTGSSMFKVKERKKLETINYLVILVAIVIIVLIILVIYTIKKEKSKVDELEKLKIDKKKKVI